eukprot:scaffold224125_cov17-Tisochrysis_lutea.AAC.2
MTALSASRTRRRPLSSTNVSSSRSWVAGSKQRGCRLTMLVGRKSAIESAWGSGSRGAHTSMGPARTQVHAHASPSFHVFACFDKVMLLVGRQHAQSQLPKALTN